MAPLLFVFKVSQCTRFIANHSHPRKKTRDFAFYSSSWHRLLEKTYMMPTNHPWTNKNLDGGGGRRNLLLPPRFSGRDAVVIFTLGLILASLSGITSAQSSSGVIYPFVLGAT
jgi:hypothetical protein